MSTDISCQYVSCELKCWIVCLPGCHLILSAELHLRKQTSRCNAVSDTEHGCSNWETRHAHTHTRVHTHIHTNIHTHTYAHALSAFFNSQLRRAVTPWTLHLCVVALPPVVPTCRAVTQEWLEPPFIISLLCPLSTHHYGNTAGSITPQHPVNAPLPPPPSCLHAGLRGAMMMAG